MKSKDMFYCESAINDLPTHMKQWIKKNINLYKNYPYKKKLKYNKNF